MSEWHDPAAERVIAILLEAGRELNLRELWSACPGVKRRVVRRCAERLTDEGVLRHKTVYATPAGSEIVPIDLWWHSSAPPPWYISSERHKHPSPT